jgi:hypothetical protein
MRHHAARRANPAARGFLACSLALVKPHDGGEAGYQLRDRKDEAGRAPGLELFLRYELKD